MKIIKIPENNEPVFYTECWCHSPYHSIRWHFHTDEETDYKVSFVPYISTSLGFWKRLILGIKYIFNCKDINSMFDEFELSKEDSVRIRTLLDKAYPNKNEIITLNE